MMDSSPYIRSVNYYETDRMAVVHHSNYVRYFEEARVDYLRRNGLDFAELEGKYGIMFPVLEVNCRYHKFARFDDELRIFVRLTAYTGVRFTLEYRACFPDGSLCTEGSTGLAILNSSYLPISLKRKFPEVHRRFTELLEADAQRTL